MPTLEERYPLPGENYFVNQDTGEATFLTPAGGAVPGRGRPDYQVVSPGRRLEDPLGLMGRGRTGQVEDPFGVLPDFERAQYAAQQQRAYNVANYISRFLPPERVRGETLKYTGIDIGEGVVTPETRKIQEEELKAQDVQSQIRARAITAAENVEDIRKKRQDLQTEAANAVNAVQSSTGNLNELAEQAGRIKNDPNLWRSVGAVGKLWSAPGGAAANLDAAIETLEAKSAFNVLQGLREASKTGGALGNVSNFEIDLLKNALASLRRSQSPEAFRENLQRIIDYTDRAKGRLDSTLKSSYGDYLSKAGAGGGGSIPAAAQAKLTEGAPTQFKNGQVWTLENGQPKRLK